MPNWVRPEFHELNQEEIDALADGKSISKQPKEENPLATIIGFIFMMIGLIVLAIMLMAY